MSWEYTTRITVKDMYGREEVTAPDGWRIIGFHPPLSHEYFLPAVGGGGVQKGDDGTWKIPRLIVEKIPPARVLQVRLCEGEERATFSEGDTLHIYSKKGNFSTRATVISITE